MFFRVLRSVRLQQQHASVAPTSVASSKQNPGGSIGHGEGEIRSRLQRKERELQELQNCHQELLQSYDEQETEIQNLAEWKGQAENTLEVLQIRSAALQQELQACKDDLFRLQPIAQVPDREIMNDFESLSQQIANWIDEEINAYEKIHPATETWQLFSDGGNSGAARILQKFPEAGEYLIRYTVHEYLQEHMFGKGAYLLGLPKETVQLLQTTEQNMASLEPPRGTNAASYIDQNIVTINTWRSETLSALAATPEIARRKEERVASINRNLFDTLSRIFPIISGQYESLMRLYEQVALPCAKFASKIQKSASIYEFHPHLCMQFNNFEWCGGFRADELMRDTMIDMNTRKILKPDSYVVPDKQGNIGFIWMLLEPSLVRIDPDKKHNTELRQKVFLVELSNPTSKRIEGAA